MGEGSCFRSKEQRTFSTWKLTVFACRWECVPGFSCACSLSLSHSLFTISCPFLHVCSHPLTCTHVTASQADPSFWPSFCFLTAGFFSLSSLILLSISASFSFNSLSLCILFLCKIFHPLPLLPSLLSFFSLSISTDIILACVKASLW